jgi:hypothetical protein
MALPDEHADEVLRKYVLTSMAVHSDSDKAAERVFDLLTASRAKSDLHDVLMAVIYDAISDVIFSEALARASV